MNNIFKTVLVISMLSILYVFQQAQVLEYGYCLNSNNKTLSLLVDHNRLLSYNIAKLEAPARLETVMLAKRGLELRMPRIWCKIGLADEIPNPYESVTPVRHLLNAGRVILSMFSLDTEAVAND